jgi:DNA polymerase I
MRKNFLYDIETDGLLTSMTTVHCLVLWDLDTQELLSFRNDGHPDNLARLTEAVRMLDEADFRAGHNVIKFDEPALKKVFPFFHPNRPGVVFDTLIAARLIYPDPSLKDMIEVKAGRFPGRLIGSQSLDAWGHRLGYWKGDYAKEREAAFKARPEFAETPPTKEQIVAHVWGQWNQEMQDYCDQDVRVTAALYARLNKRGYSKRALSDEMDMAYLCQKIEDNGFPFDERGGGALYAELVGEKARLEAALKETFGSWVSAEGPVKTPSAPNSSIGYWGEARYVYLDSAGEDLAGTDVAPEDMTKGGSPTAFAKRLGVRRQFDGYPFTPISITEFSPTSRFHIANRLKALYGWQPTDFTPDGHPKVDEDILSGLPYPCIPLLIDYLLIVKRLGQLAEGNQAWLKLVREGKVHGSYNTVGAVTRRATHSNPNIGQVPKVQIGKDKKPLVGRPGGWGHECRSLFGAPKGWWQIGTDASGLELRCLAHFMGFYDGGAYGLALLEDDIHTVNQEAAGLPSRDSAKTFIYAFLYGAGDEKIGSIVGGSAAVGKALKTKFMAGLPALGNLLKAVKNKAREHKTLNALDGGLLQIRSDHAALNTLLQSAGALICKRWGVLMERELLRRGYRHGWDGDFAFMAWVHDEFQIAARTQEIANEIGEVSRWAIKQAEEYFAFKCPLDVDFKIGRNWAECH